MDAVQPHGGYHHPMAVFGNASLYNLLFLCWLLRLDSHQHSCAPSVTEDSGVVQAVMSYPWRTLIITSTWTLLGHPRRGLESTGVTIFARATADESSNPLAANAASSIAIGVVFCLFLVALAGLAVFYLFKGQRQRPADVESVESEKRGWRIVDDDNEKKGYLDWWRQSHSIPDRVEPPSSAPVRTSLQRLRSALTRKGTLGSDAKDSSNDSALISKFMGKVTSPTTTIVLPMQTVPAKPRYPSVLERGYRIPLYPTQSPPRNNSPPRSLTTPVLPAVAVQTVQPISVAERTMRKKLTPPPRALKITSRPLVPISERKMGLPRSPAHRQRRGFMNQFKHPFLPLKDSDTAFPTISAPMPSSITGLTNPKLGYSHSIGKPRYAPMVPGGPRHFSRASRRIPAPIYETKPSRPLLPATPLHLREDVRVLPPGLSPSVRPNPTPI